MRWPAADLMSELQSPARSWQKFTVARLGPHQGISESEGTLPFLVIASCKSWLRGARTENHLVATCASNSTDLYNLTTLVPTNSLNVADEHRKHGFSFEPSPHLQPYVSGH